jgi:hypothetical protein
VKDAMTNPVLIALMTFAIVLVGMFMLTGALLALRWLATLRPSPKTAASAELDPELVAVLAAAAREALHKPVRIYQVHIYHEPVVERWSRAGRVDIMVSHRVERRR